MGTFRNFQDYLETKKELMDIDDGLVGKDNDGPLSTHLPKDAFAKTKPAPYENDAEDEKNVVWQAGDSETKTPLGDEATPGMTPANSVTGGKKPESKVKHPKFVKMTSEEFIEKTKEMTNEEFLKYMTEHNDQVSPITDLYGNDFTPDPMQTIQYLGGLLSNNRRLMERFVREMKRRGGLETMLEELLDHPEVYDMLAEVMENDECGTAQNLARSMNERYMNLIGSFDFGETVQETIDAPPGSRFGLDPKMAKPSQKPQGGTFGGGGGPDATPNAEFQGQSYQKQGGSFGGGGVGTSSPQFADQQPLMPPGAKAKGMMRYMGESASDNLIKAMSGYDHMRERMKHHCIGPNC